MSTTQKQLSKTTLHNIIKKRFGGDVEILNTETFEVVPKGENYMCDLLRVVIHFSTNKRKNESFSTIVKSVIQNEYESQFTQESNFCNREKSIYQDILPMFAKQDYSVKVGPELYHFSEDTQVAFVLEDLKSSNYKMADRKQGLNLEHCLIAVAKLAYFHAASLKLYEDNPTIMDHYGNEVFQKSESNDIIDAMLLEGFQNVFRNEPTLQRFASKIDENLPQNLYEGTKPDPDFSVLNHGDFWCNNMLFKYDEDGSLKDVLFIDYQMSMFTTPFYDLHYFLVTSTTLEVKRNGINDVIDHYYNNLSKNMKILNVKKPIPSRDRFHRMFVEKALIGFGVICFMLPFMKAKDTVNASLTRFVEDESFRDHCFSNVDYVNTLKIILPFYESLGLFNK